MLAFVCADDTNLFYSGNNLSPVCETVSTELDRRHSWCQVNKLSLTFSKTHFMICCNKQCEYNHVVSINGMNINIVYVKFIWVHIDSHLNWCEHINHIKSKLSTNVSILQRVKHLDISTRIVFVLSTSNMVNFETL